MHRRPLTIILVQRPRCTTYFAIAALGVSLVVTACALKARSTLDGPPSAAQLSEFWNEPTDLAERNLLYGPGGLDLVPSADERFELVATDTKGYSPGYDVRDSAGRQWSVKLGPEARTEVVVSRLVWAAGYHQLPTYYVPRWVLVEAGMATVQPAARFRLDRKKLGTWAWHENPFVGTRPFAGLFVLMVMVNNWDLKNSQNARYPWQRGDAGDGAREIHVVKDLGASLGRTPWFLTFRGSRDDVDAFEEEGFIKSIEGDRVEFHYGGAWREPHLRDSATPADVRWIVERLSRLSPRQWTDAFRAGGYRDEETDRYIRRLQEKVDEGLKLAPAE